MNNRDGWRPSKYVYEKGKLIASRDPNQVSIGSRLIVDLVAAIYDSDLRRHAKGKLPDLGCGEVSLYIAYKDFITENVCVVAIVAVVPSPRIRVRRWFLNVA